MPVRTKLQNLMERGNNSNHITHFKNIRKEQHKTILGQKNNRRSYNNMQ